MNRIAEEKAVALLSEALALECGVHPIVARQIRTAAALHDIGKAKIPTSILNKPGKLDGREFEIIKTHTRMGAEFLGSIQGGLGEMTRLIALYHHEWYDGAGYWGRRTCELPNYVQITSIADVFTALINERPYKVMAAGGGFGIYTESIRDAVQSRAGEGFPCAGAQRARPRNF